MKTTYLLLVGLMIELAVTAACASSTPSATVSPSPPATSILPQSVATLSPSPVLTTSTIAAGVPSYTPFSFRIVLSGPAAATAHQDIAYSLYYQRVSPSPGAGNAIVITYNVVMGAVPTRPAATLVSVKASDGAPPVDLGPQIPGDSENYGLAGDSGTLQVIVHPTAGFSGPLTIGFYVRGTGIQLPEGSADRVTTIVGP